jgi:cell wall-associated NlpC family hydrolase
MAVEHFLTPKGDKTLQQSYSGLAFTNSRGNAECVEFIRQTLQAPEAIAWTEGRKIKRGIVVLAGTAIATFTKGKYPLGGNTGKHAAIYLGQDSLGIQVLDQWRKQGAVKERTIKWKPTSPGLSNDGNAFSVIEW